MDFNVPRRSSSQKLPSSSLSSRVSIQMIFSLYKKPEFHKRISTTVDLGGDQTCQDLNIEHQIKKQQPYPLLSIRKSGSFTDKVPRELGNRLRGTTFDFNQRGRLGSIIGPQDDIPKCLKGVVQDESKIQKLQKELKVIKQELSTFNINLKVSYHLGFIDDKVYELCKDPDLNLVDEKEPLPEKIYCINDIKVLTKIVVKKIIRYQGVKQRISYLLENLSQNSFHHNHIILDKPMKKPAFPVQFDKQRGRLPLSFTKFYPQQEKTQENTLKTQNSQKEEMRKTFQNDELRKTHNFESYTERTFILLKPCRSLNSSQSRRRALH